MEDDCTQYLNTASGLGEDIGAELGVGTGQCVKFLELVLITPWHTQAFFYQNCFLLMMARCPVLEHSTTCSGVRKRR